MDELTRIITACLNGQHVCAPELLTIRNIRLQGWPEKVILAKRQHGKLKSEPVDAPDAKSFSTPSFVFALCLGCRAKMPKTGKTQLQNYGA
jgi:hypothetical protein